MVSSSVSQGNGQNLGGHIHGGGTVAESHDMGEEEDNESYNYLYDQDNAEEPGQVAENGDGGEGHGSGTMQQDTSANRGRADSGFGALGHGEQVAISGATTGHHHGKPKYQKIPPEKYAHITIHHSPKTHHNT